MVIAALLLLQVQPTPVPMPTGAAAQPDIELDIRATARRIVVENKGEVDLTLRTSLNGREGENNLIDVRAPDLPQGRRELDNVEVRVRAEARIPAPRDAAPRQEPATPQ
jgi:hypothetical protein